ncbi:MAG: hypothetical protein EPN91_05555 [Salinibacterium sp.]|nr:MAG: hypothetical protein EPN91_05555 [Salinibacterium sp.]
MSGWQDLDDDERYAEMYLRRVINLPAAVSERTKAELDMGAFGIGAVFVSNDGTVSHVPIGEMREEVPK